MGFTTNVTERRRDEDKLDSDNILFQIFLHYNGNLSKYEENNHFSMCCILPSIGPFFLLLFKLPLTWITERPCLAPLQRDELNPQGARTFFVLIIFRPVSSTLGEEKGERNAPLIPDPAPTNSTTLDY